MVFKKALLAAALAAGSVTAQAQNIGPSRLQIYKMSDDKTPASEKMFQTNTTLEATINCNEVAVVRMPPGSEFSVNGSSEKIKAIAEDRVVTPQEVASNGGNITFGYSLFARGAQVPTSTLSINLSLNNCQVPNTVYVDNVSIVVEPQPDAKVTLEEKKDPPRARSDAITEVTLTGGPGRISTTFTGEKKPMSYAANTSNYALRFTHASERSRFSLTGKFTNGNDASDNYWVPTPEEFGERVSAKNIRLEFEKISPKTQRIINTLGALVEFEHSKFSTPYTNESQVVSRPTFLFGHTWGKTNSGPKNPGQYFMLTPYVSADIIQAKYPASTANGYRTEIDTEGVIGVQLRMRADTPKWYVEILSNGGIARTMSSSTNNKVEGTSAAGTLEGGWYLSPNFAFVGQFKIAGQEDTYSNRPGIGRAIHQEFRGGIKLTRQ